MADVVTPRTLRVLSLGAGVQSSTLLLLSLHGMLPRLDAAIFADTGWEPRAVYEHLAWLADVSERGGIPVYRVTKGNIRADALRSRVRGHKGDGHRWVAMAFFVDPRNKTGQHGMIRPQCTLEYKLQPIRKLVRKLAGLEKGERVGDKVLVEQWIGISADETHRLRMSRDYWIKFRFPLVFDLKPAWRRMDCLKWLRETYAERRFPRSACIGCPFRSNAEWRQLRDESPAEWQDAVGFDAAVRKSGGRRGDVYVHASLKPLGEAPIDDVDPRQGSLFSCGVCAT